MSESTTAFGPGRVNLIGEHTDYNQGLALPFAISDGVTVRAARRNGDRIEVVASDLQADDSFELADPARISGWRGFARGLATELQQTGLVLRGARLEISGSVPRGSGLSSSAALEVALSLALLDVSDAEPPDRIELARICSRVENEWVGAQTGLLDQIASLCGETGSALRVDFRTLEITPVKLELGGYSLVTLNSGEQHSNAGGGARAGSAEEDDDQDGEEPGYNERRAECRRACEQLGVESLRDVTLAMAGELPDPLAARARHVITENTRVDQTVQALSEGDLERVGGLLDASHASLRDCFEISTPAVEATVQRLCDAGAVGARIMGGGFGGYVLGLLPPGATPPEGAITVEPGPGGHLLD